MHRLYIRKGTNKRTWIAVGYYCDECSKTLKESDLMKTGGLQNLPEDLIELKDRVTNPKTIVLDPGYSLTKVGFTGEKEPRYIFDSAVYFTDTGDSFIQNANKIETKTRVIKTSNLFRKLKNSEVLDQEVFEIFLAHIFEKLNNKSSETAVWVVEKYYNARFSDYLKGRLDVINNSSLPEKAKDFLRKEKMVEFVNGFETAFSIRRAMSEVFFTRFNIPKIYFSLGELLSLYADEQVTGVVVGIGANSTRIIPIYEGFIISHGVSIREKAGQDVVKQLEKYVQKESGDIPKTPHEKSQILKNIRLASEDLCYISQNIKEESQKWTQSDKYIKSINIINDKHVKLNEIRYLAPEILFEEEPLSILNNPGDLADAVIESIQKCDKGLAKSLYANILLVGGGSMFEGFKERFTKSFKSKVSDHLIFNITAKSDRLISGWIGGSMLSGMKLFEERNFWVSKAEYDEKGSTAVDRCI